VNALTNPEVGQYLNRHFVPAFQKVATFQVNGRTKQGGNVAAYFCTPDGLVLHAVAGPVDANTFLREARWANETYNLARLDNSEPAQLRAFFRNAHLQRLQAQGVAPQNLPPLGSVSPDSIGPLFAQFAPPRLTNQGKVHLLLAMVPLPRLGHVYKVVFEKILNERISTNPVAVIGAGR
jgi:hypothetical protein